MNVIKKPINRSAFFGKSFISRFSIADKKKINDADSLVLPPPYSDTFHPLESRRALAAVTRQRIRDYRAHMLYKEQDNFSRALHIHTCEGVRLDSLLSWIPEDTISSILYLLMCIDYHALIMEQLNDREDIYGLLVNIDCFWNELAKSIEQLFSEKSSFENAYIRKVQYASTCQPTFEWCEQLHQTVWAAMNYMDECACYDFTLLSLFLRINGLITQIVKSFTVQEVNSFGYDQMKRPNWDCVASC